MDNKRDTPTNIEQLADNILNNAHFSYEESKRRIMVILTQALAPRAEFPTKEEFREWHTDACWEQMYEWLRERMLK
jgi:hypothetical protein